MVRNRRCSRCGRSNSAQVGLRDMSEDSLLNFESLLAPRPGENPAGEDLRYTLYAAISELPVTGGPQAYSFFRYEESRTVDNLGRQDSAKQAEAIAAGKITGEQFDRAVAATPAAFYRKLLDDVREARGECSKLEEV